MKKKICNYPSCNILIPTTERYCSLHKKEKIPFESAIRYNETLYNTTTWRKLRKEVLKEQPVCSKCRADIKLEIHHIIPPRGNEKLFFDKNNLTVVCQQCHRILTNQEIRKSIEIK
jgi:5-methylcytosine-specific restriction endonuclease McrA